ncbi:hypothetical protein [Anaerolentibacter hominis]|uniref:hypothetical protein n=1 Tax=Anaerolentibacter hominis TaxID=3079009 RepID=UPI0031B866CF
MYPVLSIFISILGLILFCLAGRIAKNNPIARNSIRAIGIILIAAGLILLYLLLSDKLVLPLSN